MTSCAFLTVEGTGIRYLGYLLPLTRAERALTKALIVVGKGLSGRELARMAGISEHNISTVAASVNSKAMLVGGRPLILSGKAEGYRLNGEL